MCQPRDGASGISKPLAVPTCDESMHAERVLAGYTSMKVVSFDAGQAL
jgi:hypothetical protein